MIDACADKSVGDECSIDNPNGDLMTGTCVSQDDSVICEMTMGDRPQGDMPNSPPAVEP